MAARNAGESKQGLIISLVLSVLFIIVLGVVAYYGYADQARLEDLRKKAEGEAASMKKIRDWEQFKALVFKAYIGFLSKEDGEALATMRTAFDGGSLGQGEKDRAEIEGIIKELDDPKRSLLGWNQAQTRPARTYRELVADLNNRLDKAYLDRDNLLKNAKATKDDFDQIQAAKDEELRKAKEALAAAQKQVVLIQEQKAKAYVEALGLHEKQEKELEAAKFRMAEMQDQITKLQEQRDQEIQAAKTKYDKLAAKLPPDNPLEHDTPKGRIVSLDRQGSVAFVNLGSADNVRPGLTFAIVGTDLNGRPKKQPKGNLQIANVQGPHTSMARITETVNPSRDPIVPGDLIFNPVWSPSLHEHIAIAGLIDISGDGRDDTPEFIRNLQQQGIVVDAYLDLKDVTIKGRGMGFQTTYLVLGDTPDFGGFQGIREGDVRFERAREISEKIADMQKKATELGVKILPLRQFVSLIGYRLPHGAANREMSDFNLYRRSAPAKTEAPTDAQPMAPPAEKKDEKEK